MDHQDRKELEVAAPKSAFLQTLITWLVMEMAEKVRGAAGQRYDAPMKESPASERRVTHPCPATCCYSSGRTSGHPTWPAASLQLLGIFNQIWFV